MFREEMLNHVKSRKKILDFIVISGGATGVGCAVDAASREFDVLLLEHKMISAKELETVRQNSYPTA